MKKILSFVAFSLVLILGLAHPFNQAEALVTAPFAGATYALAGAGISALNSTIILQSFTVPQTGYKLQDSDLSDTFYVTFESGNTKKQEIASCTTVVQNGNGTASLSGCLRGLLPFNNYVASTTYAFPHGGGTSVIFSDPPQLFNEYAARGNNEQISGQWGFAQLPTSTTSTPTMPNQLVTVYQLTQATTTGGINASETVKGVSELATGAEGAAGTSLGSTGARLTLPASLASSSPQSAGNYVVMSSSTGKINAAYGGTTSSLATTNSGGTVVQNPASASITPSTTLATIPLTVTGKLDGATWIGGSLTGNSSTTLHYHPSLLNMTTALSSANNNANSTTIYSFTVPTSTITTSTAVTFEIPFDVSASGNDSLTLRLVGNGTVIMASSSTSGANFNGSKGVLRIFVLFTGTTAQSSYMSYPLTAASNIYLPQADNRTSAVNIDQTITFSLVAFIPTGGAGLSFNARGMTVRFDRL